MTYQATLLMPLSGCFGLSSQQKQSVKADLLTYSNFVTVLGQCLRVAITISNIKFILSFVCSMEGFPNPVTYSTHMYLNKLIL